MQADKLDKEILDAFRQLSHEQKLSIIASLASALAEQEEASSVSRQPVNKIHKQIIQIIGLAATLCGGGLVFY